MELVGLSEVAEMAGVSRQAVVNWRARFGDFPAPDAELASGPVWEKEKIEKWLKKREAQMEGTIARVAVSGKSETREVGFTDFDSLELASAIEADIVRADIYSVAVTADSSIFDHIDIVKTGSVLKIRLRPWIFFRDARVHVAISMPELRSVRLSGATRATVNGFTSDKTFEVNMSGASKMRLDDMKAGDTVIKLSGASRVTGKLDAADCRVEASGASTVELKGKGNNIRIDVSGASKAHLLEFDVVSAEAKASGASHAEVAFSGKLDAEAGGASHISYRGEGTLGRVRISGASTLDRR